MLPTYHMVAVNLLLSLTLLVAISTYYYIYPKKTLNPIFLLILISLIPVVSVFREGAYESGGFTDHIKFSMSFYNSIREGVIFPIWDSYRCGGFGCPVFMYLFNAPYYLISLTHMFGFSFVDSLKIFLATSYVLSGVFMYLFIKDSLGKMAGFIAAIFYLFAPYHLVDLHFRTDIAEILCFTLLPIQFLATKKIIEKRDKLWICIGSANLAILILSHQAISLTTVPIILIYSLILWFKNKKRNIVNYLYFFSTIILGILLTTYYWLPILINAKSIWWGLYGNVSFEPMQMFLYSPWRFGFLYQGPMGQLGFLIGYLHLFFILFGLYVALKWKLSKKTKYLLQLCIIFIIILFIMMQSFSKPLWEIIPIISKFQFSYRFLLFIAFFSSIVAAICIQTIKKKEYIFAICLICIAITGLNWGHRRTIPSINDSYLEKELKNQSPNFEVVIPTLIDYKSLYKRLENGRINNSSEKLRFIEIQRSSTNHEYIVNSESELRFTENTYYYPGWTVLINNKETKIDYKDKKFTGLITFKIPKGLSKVNIVFEDTLDRKIGKLISVISAVILISIGIKNVNLKSLKKRIVIFLSKERGGDS